MKEDVLTKFIELAEDHYWDSFEGDRDIILVHINQLAILARKEFSATEVTEQADPADEAIETVHPKQHWSGYLPD